MDSPLEKHVALIGFMGAGKTTLGKAVAERLGRRFLDTDRELERETAKRVPELFGTAGESAFRLLEARRTVDLLKQGEPSVLALGGGAVLSQTVRAALSARAVTVYVQVDPDEAWRRVEGSERPLAAEREQFLALHRERQPIYAELANATARDAEDVVLAAGSVHVERGSLHRLGELLPGAGPIALVADRRVASLHGLAATEALGVRLASRHSVPEGEAAKEISICERLWDDLTLGRDGTLVALGGGSTTDVAGFTAATYLRGIAWAAIPTTLVGQVDAAIGGKTAVNLPAGKNLVGAFHWPGRTLIDPDLLATLGEEERLDGTAEVVKTGLLAGDPLWELPEDELVRRCAAFKTAVCLRDPLERDGRMVLNLGHTFAHALEAAATDRLSHGRAVALGLLAALRLSGADTSAVEELLRPRPVAADRERAWAALQRDKKAAGGRIRLVLLPEPGAPVTSTEVPEDEVRRALDQLIAG